MPWPMVPFGKIADFRNGLNYTRDNHGDGLKVINVGDFGDRFLPDIDSLGEINPNGIADEADYLQASDMLFVRSNGNRELIGRVMYMEDIPYPIAFSAFCIRARIAAPNALPKFYAYYFRSGVVRNVLSSIGGGASIANLNQGILNGFAVPIPDKKTQEAVVERLDAFESLLANSKQRVGLLEEAARLIYAEWFICQRFPGHKQGRVVARGLPSGWKASSIGVVTNYLNRGVAPSYDESSPKRVVNQKCIRDQQLSMEQARNLANEISTEKWLQKGDVLINSTGTGTLGRIAQVREELDSVTVDTHVTIVRPKAGISPWFFGQQLLRMESIFESLGEGATNQTELKRDRIRDTSFLLPSPQSMAAFDEKVEPMIEQIEVLRKQITQLRQARDLLLPRLISGQLRL